MKKTILFAIATALVLVACDKNDGTEIVVENTTETISSNEIVIPVTIVTENEVPIELE